MRILAIADIHGVLPVYEWLVEAAAKYKADLVIIAGDLFAGDWVDGQRRQAPAIVSALKKLSVPCFYIMGNDDNLALGYEDDRIRPLHGRALNCGNQVFVGYQYTTPFVGQVFVKSEQEIAEDLREMAPLFTDAIVLVTHSPAYGTLDTVGLGTRVGCHAIADLLLRVKVRAHIHGHIHGAFGMHARSFNAAAAGTRRAIIVDLLALTSQIISAE